MYKIYVDASDRQNTQVRLIKTVGDTEDVLGEITGSNIDVVTSISNLLVTNNIKLSDVASFESYPGPGSFTGLKKSFAITNTLNWALGIKKDSTKFDLPNYGKEPNIGK